ncbi:MAG TPA: carboxypeptidase regulatory-like domain-containing protein [Gemmatimonadaceae bacterium]|nr:carboxypeptidase regulatory-like domain-containing protein [Gemmatimonadaceae bacterium]
MDFVQLKGVGIAALFFLFDAAILAAQKVTPPPPPPPPAPAAVPTTASGTFTLEGSVVSGAMGQPIPYTTILIEPIGRERFTDQSGRFVYFSVAPGKYRIRIRQVGYSPIDTTMMLTAANRQPVFTMSKIPSTLAEMQITAPPRKCIVPEENGFVGDPELSVVLTEARKNAERERMLRRTYPFEYKLAQQHDTYDLKDSTHRVVYDTMTYRSDDDWKYRQGKVVSDEKNKLFGDVRVMRLPTLTDLADVRFLTAHCFKYSGITSEDRIPVHQIDFQPITDITAPDVEGSIFIDSATYLIRRAEFRLTRGGSVKPAILGMKVTTTYREVLPNVALFDEIRSVQPLNPSRASANPTEFRETQQLLSFRFLYGGPPGTDPSLVWKKPVVQFSDPNAPVKRPVIGPEREL